MLCASELKNYDHLQVYPLKLKFVSHKKMSNFIFHIILKNQQLLKGRKLNGIF